MQEDKKSPTWNMQGVESFAKGFISVYSKVLLKYLTAWQVQHNISDQAEKYWSKGKHVKDKEEEMER